MDGEGEVVVAREHGQPGDATGIERRQPRPVGSGRPSEAFVSLVQAAEVGHRTCPPKPRKSARGWLSTGEMTIGLDESRG